MNKPIRTERLQRSLRTTFAGLAVNAALTAGKFAAGFFGGSHALIADAVESSADMLSSIVVWRGVVVANAPADRDHPYGHGKAEPIAAAVVSVMMLLAAIGIIAKSAEQLTHPRARPEAFTLLVLLGVIVIKEGLFRFVSREAESMQSSAVQADAWHHRSDAITSLAAALGITVALLGGPAGADDAGAIIAGCMVAWNGWRMIREAANELMDAAPNTALMANARLAAGQVEGVTAVEKCQARKMGFEYFIDMHVEVDPNITVAAGHEIAHRVKDRVQAAIPHVKDVLVHIEPSQNPPHPVAGNTR
ncbi:MAG TPA: cation diffusion facilitator family transporter [Verrucomicrobiae bacterium]|jgi:cation diffusion facilitator family transporter|nr:cation diffusion facilitator family transporter [Verrucomicrobiae bacterium]